MEGDQGSHALEDWQQQKMKRKCRMNEKRACSRANKI